MTMESLQGDLKEVQIGVKKLGTTPTSLDIANFLRDTLVPFLENHVAESAGQEDMLADILEQADEILHSESAELFGAVITGGLFIAEELKKRIAGDIKLKKAIEEFEDNARNAASVLEEITIPDEDEDAEPDGQATETEDAQDDEDDSEGATP